MFLDFSTDSFCARVVCISFELKLVAFALPFASQRYERSRYTMKISSLASACRATDVLVCVCLDSVSGIVTRFLLCACSMHILFNPSLFLLRCHLAWINGIAYLGFLLSF